MVIRISRKVLRIVWIAMTVALVVGALGGLYGLGQALTPRDGTGRPVALSPSVWAAERYRRTVLRWLDRMESLDEGLENLLTQADLTDPAALYRSSDQAQRLTGEAAALVQAATFTAAPVSLSSLRDLAVRAAEGYWKAAEASARWVGAPEEVTRKEALEALEQARQARQELESSRWLLTP